MQRGEPPDGLVGVGQPEDQRLPRGPSPMLRAPIGEPPREVQQAAVGRRVAGSAAIDAQPLLQRVGAGERGVVGHGGGLVLEPGGEHAGPPCWERPRRGGQVTGRRRWLARVCRRGQATAGWVAALGWAFMGARDAVPTATVELPVERPRSLPGHAARAGRHARAARDAGGGGRRGPDGGCGVGEPVVHGAGEPVEDVEHALVLLTGGKPWLAAAPARRSVPPDGGGSPCRGRQGVG